MTPISRPRGRAHRRGTSRQAALVAFLVLMVLPPGASAGSRGATAADTPIAAIDAAPQVAVATATASTLTTLEGGTSAPAAHTPPASTRTGTSPAATTPTTTIVPGTVNRTSMNLTASYIVSATVRYGYASISVSSAMTVRNTSGGPIDRLVLNALPARLGRLRLDAATVDGRTVTVTRSDQSLRVPLGGILPEGSSAVVRIRYTAWFQTSTSGSNWLFARANGILTAYRWIPWISREAAFDRPNFGDPFVTPVSPSVRVTLTTDRTMSIATSGRRTSASGLTQSFAAENVRDFNFAASPFYTTLSGMAGDTRVVVHTRSSSAKTMLYWVQRSIARFEALVGPYPYPQITVADSGGGYAMESPAHIWIPYGSASSTIPYKVAHEIAHQWFYATVGSDQPSEPYADEAAAEFLTRHLLASRRASRCSMDGLDRTIYGYTSSCYYEVVYVQGGNFLDDIRRRMGDAAFWAGMQDYYATNRFRIAGTKRLLDTLDAHTPLDLVPTYRPRFERYY